MDKPVLPSSAPSSRGLTMPSGETILPSPAPARRGMLGGSGPSVRGAGLSPSSAPPQRGIQTHSNSQQNNTEHSPSSGVEPKSESRRGSDAREHRRGSSKSSSGDGNDPPANSSPVTSGGKSSHHHSGRPRSTTHHHHHHHSSSDRKGMLARAASINSKTFLSMNASKQESAVIAEEPSPAATETPLITTKQTQMMEVVIVWSRLKFRNRILMLAKSFNRWKYENLVHTTTGVGNEDGEMEGQDHGKKEKLGDQKNSYLLLFAENEKLREQLNDARKSMLVNEKEVRHTALKVITRIIFRARMTAKQRYYYDIWLNNTRRMQLHSTTSQRSRELEVGLQQLAAERDYVERTEILNEKLKLTLAMTVCLHEWKAKAANASITEERIKYDKQRKLIFNEMLRIRKIVQMANKREVASMQNALLQGEELSHSIDHLREQLIKAAKLSRSSSSSSSSSSAATTSSSSSSSSNTMMNHQQHGSETGAGSNIAGGSNSNGNSSTSSSSGGSKHAVAGSTSSIHGSTTSRSSLQLQSHDPHNSRSSSSFNPTSGSNRHSNHQNASSNFQPIHT